MATHFSLDYLWSQRREALTPPEEKAAQEDLARRDYAANVRKEIVDRFLMTLEETIDAFLRDFSRGRESQSANLGRVLHFRSEYKILPPFEPHYGRATGARTWVSKEPDFETEVWSEERILRLLNRGLERMKKRYNRLLEMKASSSAGADFTVNVYLTVRVRDPH